MKKRRIILSCMVAAVLCSGLTGCSSSGSGKHLLVANSHNENHPVNVGMTYLCDEMEANTDYTFSIYPNGQLGGNSDMIQMVKAGVLDIAKVSASSLEQFNPAYSIFSLPYVFQSTDHYFRTMQESEAVQEIFRSTYGQGFFAIGWYDSGSRSIYTTKQGPVETPDDLRGLKIRAQDSPTSIEMIRNMGGAADSGYCRTGSGDSVLCSCYDHGWYSSVCNSGRSDFCSFGNSYALYLQLFVGRSDSFHFLCTDFYR